MALYSVVRKASSSVLPLTLRCFRSSSRTFHRATSTIFTAGKRSVGQEVSTGRFVPLMRFSSAKAADDNLLRVLESEIECAEEEDQNRVEEIPDGFPFEIQDNPGERTIILTRKYQDEVIKVEVDMPNVSSGDYADENDDADDNNEGKSEESSIPLVVNISKGSGLCLEFGVTAFPDEISIDSLSVRQPEGSEDQLAYEGPEFHDLDENLQKAFHKFLEIRGIKPSTTNFLHEYMIGKDSKEYRMWLKNLKNFIEK